jgi:CP family cyanate transporter-like MFS transporter
VWQFGLTFLGVTSTYFGTNAFVPSYLEAAGRPDLIGGVLTALNAGQLPVSLLLLIFAGRLTRQVWSLPVIGILSFVCLAGVATTASNWTIAFAAVLGGVLAAALTLALTLPVLLCDGRDVARVSAGMFIIGYAGAVTLSILSGATWDLSGMARSAFLPIALGLLPLIVMPFLIFRPMRAATT